MSYLPQPGADFVLPSAGTHVGTCYRVIQFGTQPSEFQGKKSFKHKILISWELEEKMDDGRPFSISQTYTWNMGRKAKLRQHLESWRGIPFDPAKDFGPKGFDIKNIIGKSCLISIKHTQKGDTEYANVDTVARLMKGQKGPEQTLNKPVFIWFDPPGQFNAAAFDKLSDALKTKISASPEYRTNVLGEVLDENEADPPRQDASEQPGMEEIPF